MAKASQLNNTDQAGKAIIRLIDTENEKVDDLNPYFYNWDLSATAHYPFKPTLSGLI